jgi:hypothetical protein
MLDIGCCEGLLSDGRPFYARLWSENGTSFLSLFFSADGLSGADAEALRGGVPKFRTRQAVKG